MSKSKFAFSKRKRASSSVRDFLDVSSTGAVSIEPIHILGSREGRKSLRNAEKFVREHRIAGRDERVDVTKIKVFFDEADGI